MTAERKLLRECRVYIAMHDRDNTGQSAAALLLKRLDALLAAPPAAEPVGETPRTDEVAADYADYGMEFVRADFARQLERELSEALADAAHVRQANANYREENRIAVERAEAAERRLLSVVERVREIRSMPFPVAHPSQAPADIAIWQQWQIVMRLCERALDLAAIVGKEKG